MQLTQAERWILLNQYRLLAALKGESASESAEAQELEDAQEILENGYEYFYDRIARNISEEPFSTEEGEEVRDILRMFRVMEESYDLLEDKEGIDESFVRFWGFDGNNEREQRRFARFFARYINDFEEMNLDLDSHSQTMPMYRRMLRHFGEHWNGYSSKALTKQQIGYIISRSLSEAND